MTETNQNVKVYRGNSASLPITVTQADGTPFDPTLNARIRWRMSKTWHSEEAEALIRKELGAGIETMAGGVIVTLTPEDTNFPPAVYYHELKVWDINDVATVTTGAFIVKRSLQMADVTPGLHIRTYQPLVA